MRGDANLPFTCPSCGEKFGYGPASVLFSVCGGESSFDENLPCCGVRVNGVVSLDDEGYMQIREMAITNQRRIA